MCASRALAAWREGRDRQYRLSEQRFRYSRCRGCGLLFLSTRPVEEEISAFYPPDYGPYHSSAPIRGDQAAPSRRLRRLLPAQMLRRSLRRINSVFERFMPDPTVARLAELYQPPRPDASLLDFGCGSSVFLDRARLSGWHTIGMDFSPEVVDGVRTEEHTAFLAVPESWRQIADASLDLVRLHHVLEHLYRPREVLADVARKMKPGAWLHIGLPNPASLSSRLFGTYWHGLDCPRHVLLYRPGFVVSMLRELGFQDVVVIHETVTKDFVRSWAYLRRGLGWIEDDAILASMSGPLAAGLQIPMRLIARIGLADRFHVLARRSGGPP